MSSLRDAGGVFACFDLTLMRRGSRKVVRYCLSCDLAYIYIFMQFFISSFILQVMPVITPAFPSMNSTHNALSSGTHSLGRGGSVEVTESTKRILLEESGSIFYCLDTKYIYINM